MQLSTILRRVFEISAAPIRNPQIIWIAFPLLFSMTIVELYFGKYKKEELGWNSAVTNSLVLVFTGIDLFRRLYEESASATLLKYVVSGMVILTGFFLFYLDFYHKLPKRLAFTISSVIPMNMTAYFAVVLVYLDIPFDFISILSFLIVMVISWLVFQAVHLFEGRDAGDVYEV